MKTPVAYRPAVEDRKPDEHETVEGLKDALTEILEVTSEDHGHAIRSVHAKAHGVLEAKLTVAADLPADHAQGLFAAPGAHETIMRFSTNPGDILDDSISVPRGLALKVLEVEGERLPGSEGESVQDFVMVNAPAFAAPDAAAFLKNLRLLAKTTDRGQWAKKGLSAALRGAESVVETLGGESAMLKTMGGAAKTHPLGETYYSATPFRYGDKIAKFRLKPASPSLTSLEGEEVATLDRPDALREAVLSVAGVNWMAWEFQVQLCRDLEAMPVEDASAVWSEADSPFVTVARIEAGPQVAIDPYRTQDLDDATRFSPWSGLAAHEPLGAINRARKDAYEMSAGFRERFNGCPIRQPRALSDLPFPDTDAVRPRLPRRTLPTGPAPERRGVSDMSPATMLVLGVAAVALGAVLYAALARRSDRD